MNNDQMRVPIGPRLLEVLEVAYRAGRPVLLEGPTGIGKSQIAADLARRLGLDFLVLDLSLLEPPDLIGLPVIVEGRTHYASPAELPTSGRGILMLEELNRAEIPVMQPALQLLSARRLHSYQLPPGWTCIAAINPEEGDYQVNRLDPALRSRFLQITVCAEREVWLCWAARANLHPAILSVVGSHVDAFEAASPRSWTYASDMLHALFDSELRDAALVRRILRGYLPVAWTLVLVDALVNVPILPMPEVEVLLSPQGEVALADLVGQLQASRRGDGVAMIAAKLRLMLASESLRERVEGGQVTLKDLERLVACLPGDLREQCLESAVLSSSATLLLAGTQVHPDQLVKDYANSTLRRQIGEWREAMVLHRIQLIVKSVLDWLAKVHNQDNLPVENLHLLANDAGPPGAELVRWLRTHGPRS
ncbi:AAA family ATPase [bacterium]|nr:AAA family ATPase [bacterium]